MPICLGYDKRYKFLYCTPTNTIGQCQDRADTHFELPQDWDEAMAYARQFYGLGKSEPKEEKPLNQMTDPEFWKNKQLEAIDPCEMVPDREEALIVGKRYDPTPCESHFTVISRVSDNHYFTWEAIGVYFKVVGKKPPLPESWAHLDAAQQMIRGYADVRRAFDAFEKLYDLRQAYWQAHDNWKPDWTDANQTKYVAVFDDGELTKQARVVLQCFIAMPTEEYLDHFLKHHKALIEQARELI